MFGPNFKQKLSNRVVRLCGTMIDEYWGLKPVCV